MRRCLQPALLLVSPFLLWTVVELFLLPADFFHFRVWECLAGNGKMLQGPFYPKMKMRKIEEGDLGHHTEGAVRKRVEWETDAFGFRKRESGNDEFPVVIIGDSNVAGAGLSQEDTLASVIEKRIGQGVYPLAPADINTYIRDPRFSSHPPGWVVVAEVERELPRLPSIRPPSGRQMFWFGVHRRLTLNPVYRVVAVAWDRATKLSALRYIRARLHPVSPVTVHEKMMFLEGSAANRPRSAEVLEKTVSTVASYDRWFRGRGIRFLFLPIPNKENIYCRLLPGKEKPVFLRGLIGRLSAMGIGTIDTQDAFEREYRERQRQLYFSDDTHWNEEGVILATELLVKAMKGGGMELRPVEPGR